MKAFLLIGGVILVALAVIGGQMDRGPETSDDPCLNHFGAYWAAQQFVERQLKAPATADFPNSADPNVKIAMVTRCQFLVTGIVDAQNGFGALLRNNFAVHLTYSEATKAWTATNIIIE